MCENVWKYRLRNGGHFNQGEMSYFIVALPGVVELGNVQYQAITWTIADLLWINPPGTNLSEIWIKM